MICTLQATHKAGNSPAEMEDAAAFSPASKSLAVADGATQGSHSGPFAQAVCAEFTATPNATDPDTFVNLVMPAAIKRFTAWEAGYLATRKTQGRALAWFEEEVIGTGAFSTLVAVELAEVDGRTTFKALAVGDSCLFVVRAGAVAQSFPLTESAQFAGAPYLLASSPRLNSQLAANVQTLGGELVAGDCLILCTDALAAWTLRECERQVNPVPTLIELAAGPDAAKLEEFLAAQRQDKRIRNDDVTVAVVRIEG